MAGYAFTQSINDLHALTHNVQFGMPWIHEAATPAAEMPFGSTNYSGYGSEGGPGTTEGYLVTKSVYVMAG